MKGLHWRDRSFSRRMKASSYVRKSHRTRPKAGCKSVRHRHTRATGCKSGHRSFPIHGCMPDLHSHGSCSYGCCWELPATDAARSSHSAVRCCEERSAVVQPELRLSANNSGLPRVANSSDCRHAAANTMVRLSPYSAIPWTMTVDAVRCPAKPSLAMTCGSFPFHCSVWIRSSPGHRSFRHSEDAELIAYPRLASSGN